jgi:hypothetical protein
MYTASRYQACVVGGAIPHTVNALGLAALMLVLEHRLAKYRQSMQLLEELTAQIPDRCA